MRIIRINDLAFSQRVLPGTTLVSQVPALTGIHGMQYLINVDERKKYENLLKCFKDKHGTLHTCTITGTNSDMAESIVRSIEHPIGATEKRTVVWEAICNLLWFKQRSDERLKEGMHLISYASNTLWRTFNWCCEKYLEDEHYRIIRDGLVPDSELMISSTINRSISYVYAMGVNIKPNLYRPTSTSLIRRIDISILRGARILDLDFVTIKFIFALHSCISGPDATCGTALDLIISAWEGYISSAILDYERYPMLDLLFQIYLATVGYRERLGKVAETHEDYLETRMHNFLKKIEELLQSHPRILPFKWGILEEDLPHGLRGMVDFLPIDDGGIRTTSDRQYMWGVPDSRSNDKMGPGHRRYLI